MRKLDRTRAGLVLLAVAALGGCASYRGTPQEVTFTSSDGIELAGTLVLPRVAARPLPGVVLLHGAEAATRSFAYRMHANIFLDRGMAVLLFDKRGAGASGGDHDTATYAQLIEDALAAIRFLRDRREIDPERLGLGGASESGWLTPEIAERAGDIAFIINKVGPCASRRETGAWEVYNEILDEGASESSAREQVEIFKRLWAYRISPSPEEREALDSVLDAWAPREDSYLPTEVRPVSAAYVQDLSYDPTPYLERLVTPALYVYGSEDINIPTTQCVERLTELRGAGKPVSFRVFEGAGHELARVGVTGYRFVAGYEDLLGEFAEEHVAGDEPK